MKRFVPILAALAALGVVLALFLMSDEPPPPPPEPGPIERAMEFYGTRNVFEQPMAHSEIPEGLGDTRSATCGACHKEIYEEWQISTHARAWADDAQFQEELKKSRGLTDEKAGDVGWLCINCHTPMVRQQPQLVVGLVDDNIKKPIYVDNPEFDPVMQLDAIGCATCHVKDGKVLGPFGDTNAPHATQKSDHLLTEEVCVRCHQAEYFYSGANLGCFFSTGAEWAESPYGQKKQYCQDCHMPKVERKLAGAFDHPPRQTRRHWFGGSLIPKKPEYKAEIDKIRGEFDDGVEITVVDWTEAIQADFDKQPALAKPDSDEKVKNTETTCEEGDTCQKVVVRISNVNAGHRVPTGDPERHVDVQVNVKAGEAMIARGWTRLGSRFQWWPEVKKLTDTRLRPGESRYIIVEVPADDDLRIHVVANKFRMDEHAFEYHHLEGRYVRGVEFLNQEWPLVNPTKE